MSPGSGERCHLKTGEGVDDEGPSKTAHLETQNLSLIPPQSPSKQEVTDFSRLDRPNGTDRLSATRKEDRNEIRRW